MFGRLAAFSNLEGVVAPFAVFLVHGKQAAPWTHMASHSAILLP